MKRFVYGTKWSIPLDSSIQVKTCPLELTSLPLLRTLECVNLLRKKRNASYFLSFYLLLFTKLF
mgnify:CR=1 FL=1